MSSVSYPGVPASVAKARAYVAAALAGATDELRERAVLITSELATNAVIHGGTGFTLSTTIADGELRVAITDSGGGTPLPRQPGRTESTGRGLLIVTTLSERWGSETSRGRTTVWSSLALGPTRAPLS